MEHKAAYQRLCWISRQVPDWRRARGVRHDLAEALFIAVVALLAGAQDCQAIVRFGNGDLAWFKQVLTLAHGVPSHDLFLRLLAAFKSEQF